MAYNKNSDKSFYVLEGAFVVNKRTYVYEKKRRFNSNEWYKWIFKVINCFYDFYTFAISNST